MGDFLSHFHAFPQKVSENNNAVHCMRVTRDLLLRQKLITMTKAVGYSGEISWPQCEFKTTL